MAVQIQEVPGGAVVSNSVRKVDATIPLLPSRYVSNLRNGKNRGVKTCRLQLYGGGGLYTRNMVARAPNSSLTVRVNIMVPRRRLPLDNIRMITKAVLPIPEE